MDEKPFIVLDTNIWVGFCVGREAETKTVGSLATEFRVAYTQETREEFERVLNWGHIVANTDEVRRGESREIMDAGTHFEVKEMIEGILEDDSDHIFLEAAVPSEAQFLVTQDLRHFGHLEEFQGTRIVSCEEFLIREQENFQEVVKSRVEDYSKRLQERQRSQQKEREREI